MSGIKGPDYKRESYVRMIEDGKAVEQLEATLAEREREIERRKDHVHPSAHRAVETERDFAIAELRVQVANVESLRAKLTTARDALAAELIAHFDNMATQTVEIFDVISDIRRIAATEKGEL